MSHKCIMIQGTGSSVGKSLLVTALCRILKQDGWRVAPFKAQNMALNSYITAEGLEMGRAQVVQAEACGLAPSALMNPILLKPTADQHAQVICMGKVYRNMTAAEYHEYKPRLREMVREAYNRLSKDNDIIVIEGAGSPAEINLRETDLVNMGMAEMADAPVLLVGDIDKGGVFAWLAGTLMLLEEEERTRVKGVIINKFRGDGAILRPGLKMLEDIIHLPVLGVIPYLELNIDDEDSVTEEFYRRQTGEERELEVAVIRFPYLSNFTDFNVLHHFPDVSLRYVNPGEPLGKCDLVILPGSKNTLADLRYMRESGLEKQVLEHHSQGRMVIGICGGYQMLGKSLADPWFTESEIGEIEGLGLLDLATVIAQEKVTTQVRAAVAGGNSPLAAELKGLELEGYEIHNGISMPGPGVSPFIQIEQRLGRPEQATDGVINSAGNIFGTYIHGIFDNAVFTRKLLNILRKQKGLPEIAESPPSYRELKEKEYDRLAEAVRQHLDLEWIYANILRKQE